MGWSGSVRPEKAGYTFDPEKRDYVNTTGATSGQDYTGYPTFTISGNVSEADGTPTAGVLMKGLPGDPVTDAAGDYTASVPYNWSGDAVPEKAGWRFVPEKREYINITSDHLVENYSSELIPPNVILNPGVETGDKFPDNWDTYENKYSQKKGWKNDEAHSGSQSLKIGNKGEKDAGWIGDKVEFTAPYPQGFTLGGWSKADGVLLGGLYGLDFEIGFVDGSKVRYHTGLEFSRGTHDWENKETTKVFDKGIKSIQPHCVLFGVKGEAWFDDFYAYPISGVEISGKVTIAAGSILGGQPAAGVEMNGLPGNPKTDANGEYSVTVVKGWSGTVTPQKFGYWFTPATRDYSAVWTDQLNQDYVGTPPPPVKLSGEILDNTGAPLAGVKPVSYTHLTLPTN